MFRDWELPACFADFRVELEGHHGALAGSRRFARVLQLLGEHPLTRVRQAIEACSREHIFQRRGRHPADAHPRRDRGRDRGVATLPREAIPAAQVHVPLPDLSRFNQLLSGPAVEEPVSVFFA